MIVTDSEVSSYCLFLTLCSGWPNDWHCPFYSHRPSPNVITPKLGVKGTSLSDNGKYSILSPSSLGLGGKRESQPGKQHSVFNNATSISTMRKAIVRLSALPQECLPASSSYLQAPCLPQDFPSCSRC